jgi:amino acid transporter
MIFTRLENQSQFKSNGIAFMLGASILAAAGAENSAHMAEETHQAELVVPRAMFFATVINYINVLIVQISFYMVGTCLTSCPIFL